MQMPAARWNMAIMKKSMLSLSHNLFKFSTASDNKVSYIYLNQLKLPDMCFVSSTNFLIFRRNFKAWTIFLVSSKESSEPYILPYILN